LTKKQKQKLDEKEFKIKLAEIDKKLTEQPRASKFARKIVESYREEE